MELFIEIISLIVVVRNISHVFQCNGAATVTGADITCCISQLLTVTRLTSCSTSCTSLSAVLLSPAFSYSLFLSMGACNSSLSNLCPGRQMRSMRVYLRRFNCDFLGETPVSRWLCNIVFLLDEDIFLLGEEENSF